MTEQPNVQLPDNWRDQLAGVIEPGDLYGVDDVVRLIESWCSSLPAGDDRIDITWTTCQACGTRWTPGDVQVCPECGGPALPATAPDPADQPSNITTDITPAGLGHCQIVEIPTTDGPRNIRVHTGAPVSPQAAHALGQLVEVAEAKLAAEHPHAGVIQELVLAWTHLRIQPELVGRLMPHKARMSNAIGAVRQALDETSAENARLATLVDEIGDALDVRQGETVMQALREMAEGSERARAELAKLRAQRDHLKERRRTWLLRYRDARDELAELRATLAADLRTKASEHSGENYEGDPAHRCNPHTLRVVAAWIEGQPCVLNGWVGSHAVGLDLRTEQQP